MIINILRLELEGADLVVGRHLWRLLGGRATKQEQKVGGGGVGIGWPGSNGRIALARRISDCVGGKAAVVGRYR